MILQNLHYCIISSYLIEALFFLLEFSPLDMDSLCVITQYKSFHQNKKEKWFGHIDLIYLSLFSFS